MKRYVLDANAVIVFVTDRAGSATVARLAAEAATGQSRLAISAVNWAEVANFLIREQGKHRASEVLETIAGTVEIVAADRQHAEVASSVELTYGLAIADSFAAALAIVQRATLVTADPDFEPIKYQLRLLRLAVKRK